MNRFSLQCDVGDWLPFFAEWGVDSLSWNGYLGF